MLDRTATPAATRPMADDVISSERVEGTKVYNDTGDKLGSIDELIIDKRSGHVRYAVLEFGGFLGIGTKPVAVSIENLRYATDANSNKYLFVNVTRDQLDKAPAYDANTFEADRNAQYLRTTAN